MNNYIINSSTIAIIGIDNKTSKIIDLSKEFIIELPALSIIENSCLYYGSSYQGRVDAANNIISNSYKVPIVVNNIKNLVFFPTISPSSNTCMWISIDYIYKVINNNKSSCKLLFKNNYLIDTNLSFYTLENQMLKSYLLSSIMSSRI